MDKSKTVISQDYKKPFFLNFVQNGSMVDNVPKNIKNLKNFLQNVSHFTAAEGSAFKITSLVIKLFRTESEKVWIPEILRHEEHNANQIRWPSKGCL